MSATKTRAATGERNAGPSGDDLLGLTLDRIPFSVYHLLLAATLGLVGFVEGYDTAITGSLLVLAREPLHLTAADTPWLVVVPTAVVVAAVFAGSLLNDRFSRKNLMQAGIVITTLFTLLIPLAETANQLIALRILGSIGVGFAIPAAYPIGAELLPAQHRRTFATIYELVLATAFVLLPFLGFLLAKNPDGFRLIALPGGLALFIVPVMVHFIVPQSPRWQLSRGRAVEAAASVNWIIARSSKTIAPIDPAALMVDPALPAAPLPPYSALFRAGQLRFTVVGILCGVSSTVAYYIFAFLLPRALVAQGAAVSLSFGLSSLLFLASIPGKVLIGFLMEAIGRRWTILFALLGAVPGLLLMALAHITGSAAAMVFSAGALITGMTVLSSFPATRMYLSEQFPTALRGRGHFLGETVARLLGGVAAPFLLAPYIESPVIFFGSVLIVVAIGALPPLLYGKETVGRLEVVARATTPAAAGISRA